MTTKESIGRKIRQFRRESKIPLATIADAVGKKTRTISNWEQGRSEPSAEALVILCRLFDKNISDFYEENLEGEELHLSKPELRLIGLYRQLNDYGRTKVHDYVDDLVASGNYERKNGPGAEVQAS